MADPDADLWGDESEPAQKLPGGEKQERGEAVLPFGDESTRKGNVWGAPFHDRVRFTLRVLWGLASAYLITLASWLLLVLLGHPTEGEALVDLMKTVLPAMVTLVLGYIINDRGKS